MVNLAASFYNRQGHLVFVKYFYLSQGGCVSTSVCLIFSRITQKVGDGLLQTFLEQLTSGLGTID